MKLQSNSFFIGASTAAHQVEGNNIHSDFWTMENMKFSSFKEPSLDAVDHYNRYEEDIKLMAEAGLTAYRFSIEWARIEPKEGQFCKEEVEHYRKVILCCKEHGIQPIVTLHHFSSPEWLIYKGGWGKPYVIDAFARYAGYIASELGSELEYICTINEANMGYQLRKVAAEVTKNNKKKEGDVQVGVQMDMKKILLSIFQAAWHYKCAPGKINIFLNPRSIEQEIYVMKAHQKAKVQIKNVSPDTKVGLTLSLYDIQVEPGGEKLAKTLWDEDFEFYLPYIQEDDFLGVQNYTRKVVGPDGIIEPETTRPVTQMGYENYPFSIGNLVRRVATRFHGDLIITENGISTDDDEVRCEYIKDAVNGVLNAVKDGIPVKGYCYWSLLDNFEWQAGYDKTFGLIAVDRKTQIRYPKASLKLLGSFAEKISILNLTSDSSTLNKK